MLLRWLVNQYLRDAAQGKVREVVADIVQAPRTGARMQTPPAHEVSTDLAASGPAADAPASAGAPEFRPCDVVFVYALGIESGGLVDQLKGTETSRHSHGIERAGKLGRHEVAIVESGVGQQAAARATAEAIKFYQPKWVISAGFAGGLMENLRRGHIVMADEVANLAGERLQVGLKLDQASLAGMKGLHVGRLLTVDSILRNPSERRRLGEQQGAIAADMESFAVAQKCRELGQAGEVSRRRGPTTYK
jgi:adenosylhomocysteine nucleosidase